MTSGFTFDSAATVAARFAGEEQGMTYSRLQNPTVAMLEERIALMEGAEACRMQATGMMDICGRRFVLTGGGSDLTAIDEAQGYKRLMEWAQPRQRTTTPAGPQRKTRAK